MKERGAVFPSIIDGSIINYPWSFPLTILKREFTWFSLVDRVFSWKLGRLGANKFLRFFFFDLDFLFLFYSGPKTRKLFLRSELNDLLF